MAQYQTLPALDKVDPVWARIRHEAEDVRGASRSSRASSIRIRPASRHAGSRGRPPHGRAARSSAVSGELIRQAYTDALEDEPSIGDAFRADIVATVDRDPATHRLIEPVLYYKGFHAIQTHRLAHWLWGKGRRDFAYYLQSRSSSVFQCDIHPAAASAAASSSTTPPASWSARPR